MLEQLVEEIRKGGSLETRALAARLGTTPHLVEAMLEHLQRLGLIQDYADCTSGCQGCGLRDACTSQTTVRLWQTKSED
jgi:Mn-dependent DtxR family transcriptional regulator